MGNDRTHGRSFYGAVIENHTRCYRTVPFLMTFDHFSDLLTDVPYVRSVSELCHF